MKTLKVSVPTFNEIASLLEIEGIKINERGSITLEKDIKLESPVDFRMATIRRDVANIASNVCKDQRSFIEFASNLFDFVISGTYTVQLTTKIPPQPPTKNVGTW